MPDSASGPDERARQFAAIRDHARQAVAGLARCRGAEFITREADRGSDRTVPDLEPLTGARAARDIELGALHAARGYIRQAREAGHSWEQIGHALGVAPNADAAAHRRHAPQPTAPNPRAGGPAMTATGSPGPISRQERVARAAVGMPAGHPELVTRKPGRAEWKQLTARLAELWPNDEIHRDRR
jgi:hypothetical protein